jgi:hypothetical protein
MTEFTYVNVIGFVKFGVKFRNSDMMPTRINIWKILLSKQMFRKAFYSVDNQVFPPRVKRLGRGVNRSPSVSAKVKEWLELYLPSPIRLLDVTGQTNTVLVKSR